MSHPATNRTSNITNDLAYLGLGAVTVVFGLQVLRMFIVLMGVYLRQIEDVGTVTLGVVALLVFASGLLAPFVVRVLGQRDALILTTGGLGLVRLIEQLVSSPPADVALSIAGTVLFLWFIPTFVQDIQASDSSGRSRLAFPILIGISSDTAIKGMFGTMDTSWVGGVAPHVLIAALVICQWALLLRSAIRRPEEPGSHSPVSAGSLLALGPAIALEFMLFQNMAQQTAIIDWAQPAVFAWIMAANLAGIVTAAALLPNSTRIIPYGLSVLGPLLVLLVIDQHSGLLAALALLAGQVILSLFIAAALAGRSQTEATSFGRASTWCGVGLILFVLFIFAYYASYDVNLLVPGKAVPPITAALVVLPVLIVNLRSQRHALPASFKWVLLVPAVILLFLPLARFMTWEDVSTVQGGGLPVRVMSYNIHQGFDVEGVLGIEALARVIEAQDPDIVALQEVSRGWVINGSTDTLVWLSQRLEMDYVWGPAADSTWGNAVLSRFPVLDSQNKSMPNNDEIRLDRGFLAVDMDIGNGEVLRVVATHLHAGDTEGVFREPQIRAITGFWNGADRTVLLGDLNAQPGDPEMLHLAEAGMLDAFLISGTSGPGFTSEADDPRQRIDYIWVSPDLKARDFVTIQSLASDHFPVTATLFR